MTTFDLLTSYWHLNLLAIVLAAVFTYWHWVANDYRFLPGSKVFFIGIALLLLVMMSPVEYLGNNYLFSAHMVVHIILLLIIPPLLLAGTNPVYLEKLISKKFFKKAGKIIFHPLTGWILGVGSMYVWHIPSVYFDMMQSGSLMEFQVLSLLLCGFIFNWPVFAPVNFKKLKPLESALYLFSACVGCTVLGIFITFAPEDIFTTIYTDPQYVLCNGATDFYSSILPGADSGIDHLIVNTWGITPAVDQQMGGLIMWVPACFIYITNILVVLSRWYRNS
jgi:putative membrane protein